MGTLFKSVRSDGTWRLERQSIACVKYTEYWHRNEVHGQNEYMRIATIEKGGAIIKLDKNCRRCAAHQLRH